MAEPFKMTPAARVFGMGLPRRKVENPGSIFGIDVDEPRWSLDPRLRQDMAEQQQLSMQEQALDAQQKQLQRQMQVQEAEDAAMNDIASGEEIGNIFRKNPALALSNKFRNFTAFAEPSRATKTLTPSLLGKLPPQYHGMFNELIQTQEHAQDPLGAYSKVRTQEEIDKQRGRLRKAGVDTSGLEKRLYLPEEEEDMVIKSSTKERDPEIKAMEEYLDFLQKEKASLVDSGGDLIRNPNAKKGDDTIPLNLPSPKFLELQKELDEVGQLYRSKKRGLFMPKQAEKAQNIASPSATGAAPASFKDTMKGLAGATTPIADEIPAVPDEEILTDLNSPDADENTYFAAISDPKSSMEVKKSALEKLKKFAEKPKKISGLTIAQAAERKANLMRLVEEAGRQVRLAPELEKYRKAWDQEKSTISKWIGEFAEDLGVDADELENSLIANEPAEYRGAFDSQEQRETIRDRFAKFLQGKLGRDILSKKAEKLSPFEGSEFAKELGMEGYIPGFRSIGKGKTYGDVLDAYLSEKAGGKNEAQVTPQIEIIPVSTKEEVAALPKGSKFRGPDGKVRIK